MESEKTLRHTQKGSEGEIAKPDDIDTLHTTGWTRWSRRGMSHGKMNFLFGL